MMIGNGSVVAQSKSLAKINAKSFSNEHKFDLLYRLALSKQNHGNYYQVDSIIEIVINQKNETIDSSLYIRFLLLDAENKKVMDKFEEALNRLILVEDYYKRKQDYKGVLEADLSFAEYYRATDNFDVALTYLNKANELGNSLKGGFPLLIKARMLNRKAAIYLEQGKNLDSVELLSKEVIQIATIEGDLNQVAISSNELGFLYLNLDNPEAEKYFLKAITIWDKLGLGIYANNARLNLARYFIRSKNPTNAIDLANNSLIIVKKFGWSWEEGYWYEILAKSYQIKHQYIEALDYMEKAKDGLLVNARNQYKERIAYYSNKLELKERQEEINRKEQEVLIANHEVALKSKENRSLSFYLVIVFMVMGGTIVGIVVISRQKKLLTAQKKNINNINRQLEALVAQKEILLKEVNHRVKNNLGLLSGLMYLKESTLTDTESINVMKEMQSQISTISLIHESLYQRDDVEHVNYNDYLTTLADQIIQIYPEDKLVNVVVQCGEFNPELSLAISLAMMVNELITNSLKHAFSNVDAPQIEIRYVNETNQLIYCDNGPGYSPKEEGTTLGSKLMSIFARQIHAKLTYEKINSTLITIIDLSK